jgi:hypothetical protein
MQAFPTLSAFVALAMVHLPASPDAKISLELKSASPKDAIIKVVEASGSDASYVMRELPEEPRINLKLRNVQPLAAMKMVCEAAGLGCEEEGGGDLIIRRGAAAMIGGQEVPLIGAFSTGGMGGDAERISKYLSEVGAVVQAPPELAKEVSISAVRGLVKAGEVPKFPGDDTLVDLEVREAPLAEVAARLAKAVQVERDRWASEVEKLGGAPEPEKTVVEIVVADSARDLKVTARIAKWPVRKVLAMLLEQTDLTCTQEPARRIPVPVIGAHVAGAPPPVRVNTVKLYLVPKPVLEVTGPGARPRGGTGGAAVPPGDSKQ